MQFPCGTFLCGCHRRSIWQQLKTYDPVGMLLYENNILKIDSLLSLTSLFDLEYIFLKFSCELSWTSVSFWARELKVVANAANWTLVLDIMEKKRFVELGLLALHSDERSSKVREYL